MADRKLNDQNKFILECIRLYKDLPSLWNVKSKVYYDRTQKDMAYKILLRKYKQWFPRATRDDLKKKLNVLRTNYRKELRKQLQSVESESDPVYEPTLWYFKEMSFLRDLQKSSGLDTETMDSEQNYAMILDVDEESTESRASSPLATQNSPLREPVPIAELTHREPVPIAEPTHREPFPVAEPTHREPVPIAEPTLREPVPVTFVKKRIDKGENVMTMSYENLSDNKDEYFHWAMACASDLRKMERTQQLFAKKAIAEILMEGQLGLLHRHSVKVNEPQEYGHSSKSTSFIQYETVHNSRDLDTKPFVRNPLEDDP